MRAVRVHGLRDIRIDEVPDPGAPRPSEILVAPLWGGVSVYRVRQRVCERVARRQLERDMDGERIRRLMRAREAVSA